MSSPTYLQPKFIGTKDKVLQFNASGVLVPVDPPMSVIKPRIKIIAPTGSTITVTYNGISYTPTEVGSTGVWYVELPYKGYIANITAVSGGSTVYQTVSIASIKQYAVELSFGSKAMDYNVGDSVYIPVDGVNTEFLVVHQGNPDSSIYSTTFNNSTILLMKDCYGSDSPWNNGSENNDYENCTLHSYLNSSFLTLFDAGTQSVIKQVKVPYRQGAGANRTVTSGENGLSCKIFLLSGAEVGFTSSDASYLPTNEGAKLDYFESGEGTDALTKRIARQGNYVQRWWLRSPYCTLSSNAYCVSAEGNDDYSKPSNARAIRPALVIPNTTRFDENNVIMV